MNLRPSLEARRLQIGYGLPAICARMPEGDPAAGQVWYRASVSDWPHSGDGVQGLDPLSKHYAAGTHEPSNRMDDAHAFCRHPRRSVVESRDLPSGNHHHPNLERTPGRLDALFRGHGERGCWAAWFELDEMVTR